MTDGQLKQLQNLSLFVTAFRSGIIEIPLTHRKTPVSIIHVQCIHKTHVHQLSKLFAPVKALRPVIICNTLPLWITDTNRPVKIIMHATHFC